jgi:hypothetical protein
MNKNIFFIIAGIFICSAFNKPKNRIYIKNCIDYRDIYIGNYYCQSHSIVARVSEFPKVEKDTKTICVLKDQQDSVLIINIGSQNLKFKLKNSLLIAYPEGGRYGGRFYSVDSIGLNIVLGRLSSLRLKGKKI